MSKIQRLRLVIRGAVQGVGFRPFVYRLAKELKLPGWVINSSQGVFIEVDGQKNSLDDFLLRVQNEKPRSSYIQSFESSYLDPAGFTEFEIRKSSDTGEKTVLVLPDIATCPDCLKEIFDPADRRYLYPFTNCTNCGPRYSIIESLPYDRPHTSMRHFQMCDDCLEEYGNPENRRFHAQPNACPKCGPRVSAWNLKGETLKEGQNAMLYTAERLAEGKIAAVKGLGGFHLLVDARNEEAVNRLRSRKRRNEKPFAVMMTALEAVQDECEVNRFEARLLCSPESPVVLLRRKKDNRLSMVADCVASGNPTLGIMLPYTPLHHILMNSIGFPVVATSGNLSDEPICIDEKDAVKRLGEIADFFLVHNRPIVRHVDDSLARVMLGREMLLRRARGYAPLPVCLNRKGNTVLAVGAHQKNTIALRVGENAVISQHIGDLETLESYEAFKEAISSLKKLYNTEPTAIVCDLHPDYMSTKYATELNLPIKKVQHHHAHVVSCMAENQLKGRVLGVSWDGTGYGEDGTIWGGEFLHCDTTEFKRIASIRSFMLPGGTQAVKEPRRSALGVLYEMYGEKLFEMDELSPLKSFEPSERSLMKQVLKSGFNSPVTTSMGRLFDAVSSLLGFRQIVSFEGQGAMELEFAIGSTTSEESYSFSVSDHIDWMPLIERILDDLEKSVEKGLISAKFHNSLAEMVVQVAKKTGEERVVLSGGCFQNRYLTERTVNRLKNEGFKPYWHQRVPPNDGGISLGQLYAGEPKK
ncbi:carbamoyltransferase HypF [bacterium]|nr:carbamoyltransferase HypF [bacterium]